MKLTHKVVLSCFMVLGYTLFGYVLAADIPTIQVEAEAQSEPDKMVQPADTTQNAVPADGGAWLTNLPGVTGVRMGSHGLDPVIHGQKYNQLNVLLDGAYVFGGCPNRMDPPSSYASTATYDQLIVIKGVQSLLYGSGGSGGTVLFERNDPVFPQDRNYRTRLGGGYVSNGEAWNAFVDMAAGGENGFARGIVSAKSAGPYDDGDGNEVRSGYDETAGVLDLAYKPDADSKLSLSLEATRAKNILYAGSGMDSPLSDHDLIKLGYQSQLQTGAFNRVEAEVYSSAVDHVMDNYSLRTNTMMWMRVPSKSDTAGGRIKGDMLIGNGLLTLGMDVMQSERDATRYGGVAGVVPTVINSYLWPGASIEQWGMVAEYASEVSTQDRYTIGLRVDRVDASASKADLDPAPAWADSPNTLYNAYYGVTAEARDETNVGGLLRFEHKLSGTSTTLIAGLSRTVRTADATERFIAGDNMSDPTMIWVGNPGLDPEAHHQLDFGLEHKAKQYTAAVTLYYDRVNDYILRDSARGQDGILLSDLATIYRNVDAEVYGIDMESSYEWNNRWSSNMTLAYVHATNTTESRPIAQTPPLEGTLSLEYRRGAWMLGGLLRAVAKQTRVDDDLTTGSGLDVGQTPGFTVYNLYGSYSIDKQSKISFGVDNVTDKTYAEHLNKSNAFDVTQIQVNEPGRAYWAKVSMMF